MKRRTGRKGQAGGLAQVALLPVAAFAVHQLRYLLAFGGHMDAVLRTTGHAYLNSAVPWLILLIALVVGGFLRSLGCALAGQTTVGRYTVSLVGLWLACSASLLAIFACQELLEGIFATGHPAGLIGVFGYGGWWSVPAAVIVGLVLASVLHGALWALRTAARLSGRRQIRRSRPRAVTRRLSDLLIAPREPLLAGTSQRGPPA